MSNMIGDTQPNIATRERKIDSKDRGMHQVFFPVYDAVSHSHPCDVMSSIIALN